MIKQASVDVLEGNSLIAEFMGAEWCEDDYGEWGYKGNFPSPFKYRAKSSLRYRSSFDWLIPVVEKIGELATFETDGHDELYVKAGSVLSVQVCQPIELLWKRIVEFITWYNNTQTKKQ